MGGSAGFEVDVVGGGPTFLGGHTSVSSVGLIFGVGVADERLPRRGVTHLCEHLVLSDLDSGAHWMNGTVDINTCLFVAEGEDGQMASFLNGVVRRVGDLPLDRFDTERSILRAE